MKLVLTILFGLFVFISIIGSGFILIIPKDKLTAMVRLLPVIGPHTGTIVNIKNDLANWKTYLVEDTLYAVTSTWRDITGLSLTSRVQKVVILLEPVRTTKSEANRPSPIATKIMSTIDQKKIPPLMALIEEAPPKVAPATSKKRMPLTPIPQNDAGAREHKTGLTFYKGVDGASKNFKTAREWFLKAATKGNAAAQYNLGVMSYLGQGIEKSSPNAAKWFEQAAKQDNTLAQYNLGFLFFEGKGVKKDYLQAFMWIDRAARLGDKKAIEARPTIEKLLPKDLTKGK